MEDEYVAIETTDRGPGTGVLGFIRREVDLWSLISILSLFVPIASIFFPDIDDTFALLTTFAILITSGAIRTSENRMNQQPETTQDTEYTDLNNDVLNHLMTSYRVYLRNKFAAEGHSESDINAAIQRKAVQIANTIEKAINTGIQETAINFMENGLSQSGIYFQSPYTGKKYAFVFGTPDEVLAQFVHDDYQPLLKDSGRSILNALQMDAASDSPALREVEARPFKD